MSENIILIHLNSVKKKENRKKTYVTVEQVSVTVGFYGGELDGVL